MSLSLGYGLYLGYRTGGRAFNPDDLGGALVGWFDAEDASTLNLTGNLVNSITDKRSGLTPSQGVTASKPLFDPAGLNGRPAISGDGMDDGLAVIATLPYPTGAAPSEIWALVSVPSNPTELKVAFAYGSDSVNSSRRVGVNITGSAGRAQVQTGTGSAVIQPFGPTRTPFTGAHVLRSVHGATESSAYDNGETNSAVAGVPATINNRMRIFTGNGTTNFFVGAINSIYIIDPTHPNWTPENQAALLAYLKQRGGIA